MSQPPRPSLMKAQFIRADLVRDPDIGGERQRKSAAGGRALDQRNDRLRATPHQHHDVGNAALRVQRLRHAGRLLLAGAALHRMLEIEPGAERCAGAFQHDHAGGAVALQAFEIGVQCVDQRRDRAR